MPAPPVFKRRDAPLPEGVLEHAVRTALHADPYAASLFDWPCVPAGYGSQADEFLVLLGMQASRDVIEAKEVSYSCRKIRPCVLTITQTVAKVPTKCQGVIPASETAAEHACNEMRPAMWHRGPGRQWLCDACFDRVAPRHVPLTVDAAQDEPAAEEDDGADIEEDGEAEAKVAEGAPSEPAVPAEDAPTAGNDANDDGKMAVE